MKCQQHQIPRNILNPVTKKALNRTREGEMGRLAAQTYAAHCANFSSSCSKLIASSGSLMLLEILLEDSERVKLKVQELMRKGDILLLTDKKRSKDG